MIHHKSIIEFGIIGLGRFGYALSKKLTELGKEIMAIDTIENRVKKVRNLTENAFLVGALDKETLLDCGIQNCATVVICIGDSIDLSVLTTLNVVSMEVPRVIARAMSYEQGLVLEKIGAEVISPENDMAVRLANRLVNSSILETIELRGDITVAEIKLTLKVSGLTVQELNLRQKYYLNIIALEHKGETITEIGPDCVLYEDDILVVVGKRENINMLEIHLAGQK
ncbi:TrkA family potassium uptake protein [Mobilitalea sibirica]|uniref:TrkA family potassium uptake protein n=1 Tax=Mobilitalea sibirica TaxID=1462919 RepID=A0A8J7HBY8_9FIRM|nr:TrkA family potassium uptake protein [Mobilitalea sibirica]MBH1940492.1 TrkA family potassium uptake protein [Mobilitalea sibirica]